MKDYTLTEQTMVRIPVGIARAVTLAIVCGAFWAGMQYFELREISRKISRLEEFERRIIRIETKLGISGDAPTTGTVAIY